MKPALALLSALSALSFTSAAEAEPPNVLVFMLDDVGDSKISSYAADTPGYAPSYLPDTQTIDDLAARGLRFQRFWTNPNCSPTRASLHTGRLPLTHGVGSAIPDTGPDLDLTPHQMLAQSFLDAGYDTALFGKWHLGFTDAGGTAGTPPLGPITVAPHPTLAGLQRFFGTLAGDLPGYGAWTSVSWSPSGSGAVTAETTHATTRTAQAAISWIAARQAHPFFAVVSFHAPHSVGGGWLYGDADPSRVRTQFYRDCMTGVISGCDEARTTYAALLEHADLAIEQVLASIPPAVLSRTLIVVMGDNGTPLAVEESVFDQPGRGKSTAYESGVRAPLVIADGGTWLTGAAGRIASPGRAIRVNAHAVDLYQTLHDVVLGTTVSPSDGASFGDCFSSSRADCGRTSASYGYAETFKLSTTGAVATASVALRYGNLKLVSTYDPSLDCMTQELYDVRLDPLEQSPLSLPVTDPGVVGLRSYFSTTHSSTTAWGYGKPFC